VEAAVAVEVARALGPERVSSTFAAALGAGDLEAATALFVRDGCLVTPDATSIVGREEIRPVLRQLIDRRTRIEVLANSILQGGEVAIAIESWRLSSSGGGEDPFVQTTRPALALRRLEGVWKISIAAPWGWAPTDGR